MKVGRERWESDVFGVNGRIRCRQAMYPYLFSSRSIVSRRFVIFCLKGIDGDGTDRVRENKEWGCLRNQDSWGWE